MGILDFLQQPDAQLGIGLLAAGGPMTDPNQSGFGQRLQGAMQGMTRDQMAKAQLLEMQTKAAVDQYSLQRMKDWQSMLTGGMSSAGASPTGASPAISAQASGVTPPTGGMSAPMGGAAPVAPTASATQQSGGGFPFALPGVGDLQSRAIAFNMSPADYMKMYADKAGPQTDIAKLMVQAGIDPSSALGKQMTQQAIAKSNDMTMTARGGGVIYDKASGRMISVPAEVPGTFNEYNPADGSWTARKVANATEAMSDAEAAKKRGINTQTPSVGFAGNTPVYRTVAQDVNAAGGGSIGPGSQAGDPRLYGLPSAQPGMTSSFQGDPTTVLAAIANIKDPQERANAADAYARQGTAGNTGTTQAVAPQLAPGAEKGALLSQEELSKKGSSLAAENASANTVISRLQNIKMLAPGAITGAETSRRDFMNGLLSLAGIKGAEDSKTASDLVDKNSAQIVTALRMGQGGAGTDALQTLLGAANPNRHMTVEAINDAADQLIASQKMAQAKAKMLTPHVLARDPQAYGAKELAFDQAADPRVFQLSNMNDKQAADFIKKMQPQDAQELLQKRQQLKAMGAL